MYQQQMYYQMQQQQRGLRPPFYNNGNNFHHQQHGYGDRQWGYRRAQADLWEQERQHLLCDQQILHHLKEENIYPLHKVVLLIYMFKRFLRNIYIYNISQVFSINLTENGFMIKFLHFFSKTLSSLELSSTAACVTITATL